MTHIIIISGLINKISSKYNILQKINYTVDVGGESPRHIQYFYFCAFMIRTGVVFGCVECNHIPLYVLSNNTYVPDDMNGMIFTVLSISSILPFDVFDIYNEKYLSVIPFI